LAVVHLRCREAFECRLDEERFQCTCPLTMNGYQSFSVLISDITDLERHTDPETHYHWFIGAGVPRHWVGQELGLDEGCTPLIRPSASRSSRDGPPSPKGRRVPAHPSRATSPTARPRLRA
jgi:hypothetical protein